MSKKTKVMSISIEPEMEDYIKDLAKEQGLSSSKFIRNLVEKHCVNKDKFLVVEKTEDIIPIVLRIPSNLKGSGKAEEWLMPRVKALINKLA
jgi:predicted DNA-binding protein